MTRSETHLKTNTFLLEGLRRNDEVLWQEFHDRYFPILERFGRKLGLGENDAEELAHATMIEFLQSYREGKYDRLKGRLRSWIFGIAETTYRNMHRRESRRLARIEEEAAIGEIGESHVELEEYFEAEWRSAVLEAGLKELRHKTKLDEKTLSAFRMNAIEERSVTEVAHSLGISESSVTVAKHRVKIELSQVLRRLYDEF